MLGTVIMKGIPALKVLIIKWEISTYKGFLGGSVVKNLPDSAGDAGSIPGLGRFPRGGNGNPLQVFLPGKYHGKRGLVGYSPWGYKRVRHSVVTKQQQISM